MSHVFERRLNRYRPNKINKMKMKIRNPLLNMKEMRPTVEQPKLIVSSSPTVSPRISCTPSQTELHTSRTLCYLVRINRSDESNEGITSGNTKKKKKKKKKVGEKKKKKKKQKKSRSQRWKTCSQIKLPTRGGIP